MFVINVIARVVTYYIGTAIGPPERVVSISFLSYQSLYIDSFLNAILG